MTERGVDLIGRLFEAIALEDLPTILELLDPAVEVRDHDLPDADPYHGHDGFLRWAANWEESFDETTFEVEDRPHGRPRARQRPRARAPGRHRVEAPRRVRDPSRLLRKRGPGAGRSCRTLKLWLTLADARI
jgi:ketosteroid isomerase-like protein